MSRYRVGQPDPVGAAVEEVTVVCHGLGVNRENNDSATAARADTVCGAGLGGEVDMVATAAVEADGAYGVDSGSGCTVVESPGRALRHQPEVDSDRVALAGPDPLDPAIVALDREPLLVVHGDDRVQFGPGDLHSREEIIYWNPTGLVKLQAELARGMP